MSISPKVALALYVLAIGWASPLFRLANAPPLLAGGARVGIATLILFALFPKDAWGAFGAAPRLRVRMLFAGLLLAAHFALWIPSLALTTVAASTLLVCSQPMFSAVMERFALGTEIRPRVMVGSAVALAGMVAVVSGDLVGSEKLLSSRALLGDALSLAGAVAAAAYLVVGRSVRKELPLPAYLVGVNGIAAAALLAMSALRGEPWFGAGPIAPAEWAGLGLRPMMFFFLLAVGPHLLGHGLANLAVRHYPTALVNLGSLGEPILASALAWPLFDEPIRGTVWIGAPLIVAGIGIALWKEK